MEIKQYQLRLALASCLVTVFGGRESNKSAAYHVSRPDLAGSASPPPGKRQKDRLFPIGKLILVNANLSGD